MSEPEWMNAFRLSYEDEIEIVAKEVRADERHRTITDLVERARNEHEGSMGPWPDGISVLVADWLEDQFIS